MEDNAAAAATLRPATRARNAALADNHPVFVVGCGRSGTTLLYHMILSSGGFALFPIETNTFGLLGAKFPNLSSCKKRQQLLEFWLGTKRFTQSGLERADIEARVLEECRSAGDFLRLIMEAVCRKQGVRRWAEKTPDHALYIPEIKRSIPGALIVHIIRDGRDAALSLARYDLRPYFWELGNRLAAFGVYWKWNVRKARAAGAKIAPDYYELHYEDLVERPHETLARLGEFIGHDLDYDRIRQVGVGSVTRPDTSFRESPPSEKFNPVGRWKSQFSRRDLALFEAVAGDGLEETDYPLATSPGERSRVLPAAAVSAFYEGQLGLRQWLKSRTPLRRLVGTWREM